MLWQCRGLEKNGIVRARHGCGMASVNQTRPHCLNQTGKTYSRPLTERHGHGMLCVNRPLLSRRLRRHCRQYICREFVCFRQEKGIFKSELSSCGAACTYVCVCEWVWECECVLCVWECVCVSKCVCVCCVCECVCVLCVWVCVCCVCECMCCVCECVCVCVNCSLPIIGPNARFWPELCVEMESIYLRL